jgi:hypothetical protein
LDLHALSFPAPLVVDQHHHHRADFPLKKQK